MDRIRTCISCRKKDDKRRFFRLAKTSDGQIHFDHSGNGAGRGAYVCSSECFKLAIKKNGLQKALRCTCPASTLDAIEDEITELESSLSGNKR